MISIAKITYKYNCGHEEQINVEKKPEKDVITIPTPCPKCRQELNNNQLSSQELKDMCKKLKCVSKNQEKWATKNRLSFITHWVKAASDSQANTIREIIKNETDGSWWMDNFKESKSDEFILQYKSKQTKNETIQKVEKKVECSTEPNETTIYAIYPEASENEQKQLVNITRTQNGSINISWRDIDSDLESLLLQYNYKKETDTSYTKEITKLTGKYEDRAAQISLALLDNNYLVNVKELKVRGLIALKYYEPEPTRFIKHKDNNSVYLEWDGYNRILCNRALTFINGAHWNEELKTVVIVNGNRKQIEEFAVTNGFIITDAAREVINQYY